MTPLRITLQGGPLDGDTFALVPQGSVLPPMRLSYLSHVTRARDEEYGCWLHYECPHVAQWPDSRLTYVFAGRERLGEGTQKAP